MAKKTDKKVTILKHNQVLNIQSPADVTDYSGLRNVKVLNKFTGKEEWIRPPNKEEISGLYGMMTGNDKEKGFYDSWSPKERKYFKNTMEPMYNEWLNRQEK